MDVRQYEARRATTTRWDLAEGPEWNAQRGTVTWVDIERGALYESPLVDGALPTPVRIHQSAGTLGFARAHRDGGWILGEHDRVSWLQSDGSRTRGPRLFSDEGRRLNDGAIDPDGRIIAGTLSRTTSLCLARAKSTIRSTRSAGPSRIRRRASGFGISPASVPIWVILAPPPIARS